MEQPDRRPEDATGPAAVRRQQRRLGAPHQRRPVHRRRRPGPCRRRHPAAAVGHREPLPGRYSRPRAQFFVIGTSFMTDTVWSGLVELRPALADFYRDLHAHPELSLQEHRPAQRVAQALRPLGFEVTEQVGGTGVVGLLANGDGPVVMLRADMDALPVLEQTGLPYACTGRGTDQRRAAVPLMHAGGHDMHVTCLLGAAAELAADRGAWAGTLLLVFQPAEEQGLGARAMIDDGLYRR